jgi:hypothetical protein
MFSIRKLVCAVILSSLPGIALAQTSPPFTILRGAEQQSPELRNEVSVLAARRGVGSVRVAEVSVQAVRNVEVGQVLNIQLAPNRRVSAQALSLSPGSGDRTIWTGEISGTDEFPPGLATLVLNGDSVTGSIRTPDGQLYRLRPLGNGQTAIIEMDYARMPQDHPPEVEADRDDQEDGNDAGDGRLRRQRLDTPRIEPQRLQQLRVPQRAAVTEPESPQLMALPGRRIDPRLLQRVERPAFTRLEARHRDWIDLTSVSIIPVIDVLVAYTDDAESAAGDIEALIDLSIAETNASFMNSGIWARVRLAGTMSVHYNENGRSYTTIRDHLVSRGDVYLGRVHRQRNRTNADVVALIIDQDEYCGKAGGIGVDEEDAFTVVHWDCSAGYYSFGHEIGHLLGARHDIDTDDTNTPYDYGHGFRYPRNSGGWRTIMAYKCSSNRCQPRLQYWSNPGVQYNNIDIGSTDENNRRVWNIEAARIANFR